MKKKDWIVEKLKSHSKQEIYGMYNEFLKETGSKQNINTFTRKVRLFAGKIKETKDFTVSENTEDVSGKELWEMFEKISEKRIENNETKRNRTIYFESKIPIALVSTSDWHIGSDTVYYKTLKQDQVYIANTEGMYQIIDGDNFDNPIKHTSMMVNSKLSPQDSLKLLWHILEISKDKTVIVITGNHDDWTKEKSGISAMDNFLKEKMFTYSNSSANINILLNDIEYKVKVVHKYRFNSAFNLTHTVKRLWEMGDFNFDIGIVAHHHEAGFEYFTKHGEKRLAIRNGSYQAFTGYSQGNGFNQSLPLNPTFILYPDKKDMVCFMNIYEAGEFLKHERERYLKGMIK